MKKETKNKLVYLFSVIFWILMMASLLSGVIGLFNYIF
jgi:hypothetical protein